jgi:hypothetical protein
VEVPFVLHRAGTSEGQRLSIIFLGFGILIAGGAFLFACRREVSPTRACLGGLSTAYLANAALCLVIYAAMPGTVGSKLGLLISMVIVRPMAPGSCLDFPSNFQA